MRIAFISALVFGVLSVLALVPAGAQGNPREAEPNNRMGRANAFEGRIDGEVGREADPEDWLEFVGKEGNYVTITLRYDDDDCDIDLKVFSDYAPAGGLMLTTSPDRDVFYVPGRCILKVYAYGGYGEYTIDAEPYLSGAGSGGCAGGDEVEPDDEPEDAVPIDELRISGHVCENDIDWYMLEGQEGVHPELTLEYDDENCSIFLKVYTYEGHVERTGYRWVPGYDIPGVGRTRGYLVPTTIEVPGRGLLNVGGLYGSGDSETFDVPGRCFLMVYQWQGEGDYFIRIKPGD